jgi:O-antigen/teichoic acid export membrane protein
MGGALIMIQGLFDLGVGAALVRFVAVAAARGSRPTVVIIFRRALAFYLALSLAVSIPLLIWAGELASLLPSVHTAAESQVAVLIRYVAVAFALTNVTLVLASLLQGVGRVDAAFRGQTLGWLLYVPILAIGIQFAGAAQAVGLAWVCCYLLQVVWLSASAQLAVGELSNVEVAAPSFREMLALGGWWQLSSWADFATFQLPRLAGGFVLSASALVELDVALRAAQLVVAPLSAVFPLVLPVAARAWTNRGEEGLRLFLERWFLPGAIGLWLCAVTFIPVEQLALAAWTGRAAHTFNLWLNASVLVGTAAHSSTGLFSSALLATGNISPVLRFKKRQLILALVLVPLALIGGPVPTGIALGIALTLPALAFNRDQVGVFRLHLPSHGSTVWRRLAAATAILLTALSAGVWLLGGVLPAWPIALILLPLWAVTCVLGWLWCWNGWLDREGRHTPHPAPDAGRAAF